MLELKEVRKTYVTKAGETVALNGVNIKFADKGLVFITGKSGCGKTTLLNVIGGLDNIDSGEIIVDGKKFSEFSPSDYDSYRNTLVGFVFQEYNLLSEYTIAKNIDIANELQGKKAEQKQIEELLKTVEIGGYENRKPSQLSGGQKQRVAIARALIKNPKIVLADEPTGALDSATGIQVMDLLKKLSKDKLIIVVSHEMEFAEKYADRIIRIVDGSVVEDITLNDVEVQENVFDAKEEVVVRAGTKLNDVETARLLQALEQKKKINITEKIVVRQKEKTADIKIKNEQPFSFIKSRMKFKSVFNLGAKSLVVKPVRLIFTILLSVIAFAVFGVFDSVAAYNGQRALTNLLRTSEDLGVSISATYYGEKYETAKLKLSQEYINSLNDKTGYTFRGIYDLVDNEKVENNIRANYNKSRNLKELYINSSTQVNSKEYYYRTVSGFIEFKEQEIQGKKLAPNEYNYDIVYGTYPKLAQSENELQEVAISKYMAESIMYWVGNKTKKEFGGKEIDSIDDLINAELSIENVDKKFIISAVIDCGEVPEKYEKLKRIEGDFPHNLANDYKTYLNSSCNLLLFVPDGYISSSRQANNRKTSYVIGYDNNASYKGKATGGSEVKMSYFYFNDDDFSADETIFFGDLYQGETPRTPNLKENEVLISVHNLKQLVKEDRDKAIKNEAGNLASLLDSAVGKAGKTELSNAERRQHVKEALDLLKQINNNDNYDLSKGYMKSITVNAYDRNQVIEEKSNIKLKVVGVYLDVDTDQEVSLSTTSDYYPFVMCEDGFDVMGIQKDQGIYSRAISGYNGSRSGTRNLGQMLTQKEGYCISWYENGILQVIEENGEFLSQFLKLFLYVAIVVVVFSVFMLMNYITTSIVSKRQSIGVLRALGTRGKSIFEMFLIESIIIAIINGIIACGVGYVASVFVNNYLLNVMNLTIRFALFGGRQILIILCASIVTGILASLIPIIKIVKEKPVALIRKE